MKRTWWIVIGGMLLGVPLVAQGKPLTVTGVRGVTFGAVLPPSCCSANASYDRDSPLRSSVRSV